MVDYKKLKFKDFERLFIHVVDNDLDGNIIQGNYPFDVNKDNREEIDGYIDKYNLDYWDIEKIRHGNYSYNDHNEMRT